jgi:endonuclease YncB( thermonuclease family)
MKFMQRFIVFWKRDIINKLIVIISLLVAGGGVALVFLIITMPSGKSLGDAFSQLRPLPPMATPTIQVLTSTPQPTITTMAFNIPWTPTDISTALSTALWHPFIPQSPTSTFTSLPPTALPPTSTLVPPSATPTMKLIPSTSTPSLTPGSTVSNNCIPNHSPQTGHVVEVIDGNTIKVFTNNLVYVVRYIGVSAPQDKVYSLTAKLENAKLVFRKEITLITDVSDKDPRGRLLRYVMVGNTFVNLNLIEKGFGSALDVPPDSACAQIFKQAEQTAVNSQLGVWNVTPTPKPTP